jgi:hypothetical protein
VSDKIPPRPWHVAHSDPRWDVPPDILDHNGDDVLFVRQSGLLEISDETADLIVRLVNAEPQVVAALEAAEDAIEWYASRPQDTPGPVLTRLRAALAALRGDTPPTPPRG